MKAAMQGRADCVRALMLAGGDIQARDTGRSLTPREWAVFTGRYETANLMYRLMSKPCAEQICDSFSMEWPMLEELVAQAQEPKSCWSHLLNLLTCCPYRFYINNKVKPVEDGVLEHMVRVTTCISSPFIATACRTLCPSSPPCIGKRRYAVQEILKRQRLAELFQNSRILLIPKVRDRRASLQPHGQDAREVFGDVVGHRIDAADDGSEWCSFLVDLGETIDAWNGLSRVQTVIGRAVNDVVFFQFL
uniref:Uncharacterized protein n=1 Tax=Mola mola TaxID=94237 RepID=A0A3Q3XQJ9_MOLML